MADINTQSISLFLKSHALLVATKYPASFFARVIVKYNTCGIGKFPTRAKGRESVTYHQVAALESAKCPTANARHTKQRRSLRFFCTAILYPAFS